MMLRYERDALMRDARYDADAADADIYFAMLLPMLMTIASAMPPMLMPMPPFSRLMLLFSHATPLRAADARC